MKSKPSSASLAAIAIDEAEDLLVALPQTTPVRTMHARPIALKSVLTGVIREQPKLTEAQEAKLANDAIALAREVAEYRRRLIRDEE